MSVDIEAPKPPTPKIAVVIPFFQREPGVLARTLASIATQEYPRDSLYVIVVDDGSPLPVDEELRQHPAPPGLRLVVVSQSNAGPGAARDTGLRHLEDGTEICAFIDSDDEWLGPHLRRAAQCIGCGFTAYFSNLYHLGVAIDEYTRDPRIDTPSHPPIDGDATLRSFEGDMIHQIATANVIFMSALAISVPALGDVRFPPGFKHGGEDYLYWMALTAAGARWGYSTVPEVRRGPGVNIWDRSGWGTDGLARRNLDEARYRQWAIDRYARSQQTRDDQKARIAELQVSMLMDTLHRLRRRQPVEWGVVRSIFTEMGFGWATASRLLSTLRKR